MTEAIGAIFALILGAACWHFMYVQPKFKSGKWVKKEG